MRLQVLTATGFRSLSICPSTAGITRPRGRATDESPHFRQGQQTCFSPKHQQHLWGSSSALFDWYRWICSQGQSSRGIEITIHIGLVRGLRMSGAVPLLLPGLHRNSYTFTAFFLYISIRLHCATFLKEVTLKEAGQRTSSRFGCAIPRSTSRCLSPSVLRSQLSWLFAHHAFLAFLFCS